MLWCTELEPAWFINPFASLKQKAYLSLRLCGKILSGARQWASRLTLKLAYVSFRFGRTHFPSRQSGIVAGLQAACFCGESWVMGGRLFGISPEKLLGIDKGGTLWALVHLRCDMSVYKKCCLSKLLRLDELVEVQDEEQSTMVYFQSCLIFHTRTKCCPVT